ncbi:hypothetical protein [Pleionea mediterranea]|uniref:Uncharacterized protein n=1 Tax=Pleionea mediterranea TaxID=523701 RepID=A0A316FVN1_9GAMM|nr:hypothetical protein [Pleionea mediterranea]PWK52844.1 hypothetical protein C8D97_10462 [Pleionea mediterranea]
MISKEKFNECKEGLRNELTEILEAETEELEERFDDPAVSKLFNSNAVDSKSMCALSPKIEEVTGLKLKEEWIQKGGYESVDEAIDLLFVQLELQFES